MSESSNISTFSQGLLFDFLVITMPVGMKWHLVVILIHISLVASEIERFFRCLSNSCLSSLRIFLLL